MRGDEIDNDLTVFLARRALSVDPASLPEDILIIARHCLLDWFTLALTSWHTPAVSQLEQFLGESGMQRGLATRSEEHTSELQSLMRISYAVFCLTKKNYKIINNQNIQTQTHITFI